ncbi:MAG TPA: hypothetical protein VLE53_11820 [Gemmatimonadaceae bacterium]|nr:hypothetical protein [Gemmatimonadaceae bacterium]
MRLSPLLALLLTGAPAAGQEPAGLAASALADSAFDWHKDSLSGFRVYTIPRSYAHAHRDSLTRRLPGALVEARAMIGASAPEGPIDVFFVESRSEMARLTGAGVTGFAHVLARAVFLVTNPDWRAFERHEIMHIVAGNAWGHVPTRNAWLIEGLAQAADGYCAGYPNEEMAAALAQRKEWIDLDTMLRRFREQSDLRAYLQSAAFTAYLLDRAGIPAMRALWQSEADTATVVGGQSLATWERRWRAGIAAPAVSAATVALVEEHGCGISAPRAPGGAGASSIGLLNSGSAFRRRGSGSRRALGMISSASRGVRHSSACCIDRFAVRRYGHDRNTRRRHPGAGLVPEE